MTVVPVTVIAAVARNGVIGANGAMPWHSKAELRHFKCTTMGQPLVMGRRTFEAIGHALPGRMTVVVSRDRHACHAGCEVRGTVASAVAAARQRPCREVFIAGGGDVYRQGIHLADRMVLSEVDLEPEGDTHFPEWDGNEWELVGETSHCLTTPGFTVRRFARLS